MGAGSAAFPWRRRLFRVSRGGGGARPATRTRRLTVPWPRGRPGVRGGPPASVPGAPWIMLAGGRGGLGGPPPNCGQDARKTPSRVGVLAQLAVGGNRTARAPPVRLPRESGRTRQSGGREAPRAALGVLALNGRIRVAGPIRVWVRSGAGGAAEAGGSRADGRRTARRCGKSNPPARPVWDEVIWRQVKEPCEVGRAERCPLKEPWHEVTVKRASALPGPVPGGGRAGGPNERDHGGPINAGWRAMTRNRGR